jgi:hypothetical protein
MEKEVDIFGWLEQRAGKLFGWLIFLVIAGAVIWSTVSGDYQHHGKTFQQKQHDQVVHDLCVINPDQPGC